MLVTWSESLERALPNSPAEQLFRAALPSSLAEHLPSCLAEHLLSSLAEQPC